MSKETETLLIIGGIAVVAFLLISKTGQPATTVVAKPVTPVANAGNPIAQDTTSAAALLSSGANLVNAF
jgi:hypothetical protein